jgi:3D (Asp-Asp-Asp) domain-containing protein
MNKSLMDSSPVHIGSLPISNLWLTTASKIVVLSLILIFTFFTRFSGILVEGSLSTVISNSGGQTTGDNNTPYSLSSQAFLVANNPTFVPVTIKKVIVTGYSSTPDQTDDTPFITASGEEVRDGIIASNFLPFGTKVRFPSLFGSKVFVVEDRMHKRFSDDHVDIWFSNRTTATNFGVKDTNMEILD